MKLPILAISSAAIVISLASIASLLMREPLPQLPSSVKDEPITEAVNAQGEKIYTRTVDGWQYRSHHALDLSDDNLKGRAKGAGVPTVDVAALEEAVKAYKNQRGEKRP